MPKIQKTHNKKYFSVLKMALEEEKDDSLPKADSKDETGDSGNEDAGPDHPEQENEAAPQEETSKKPAPVRQQRTQVIFSSIQTLTFWNDSRAIPL